jgi:sugar phosphate isomerase/epimerase
VIPEANVGLQVFTMRNLAPDDVLGPERTLEIAADAGISAVELAGDYYGRTPAQVRALVESFGMRVVSNHYGPRTMVQNIWYDPSERARIFAEAHTLGLRSVGTGHSYVAPLTVDGYKEMAEAFNIWGQDAVANGFDYFFFHNHDVEFTLAQGRPLYDILLEETDPRYVKFELDLGWLAVAGHDPYDYLAEHGDRFPMFHVKDIVWDPAGSRTARPGTVNGGRTFRFADVGKGNLDWARTFSALDDLRDHTYFVEHDDAGNPSLNPAGSPNTVWTGRKYLSELKVERRRR